jgi:transposase
MPVPFSIDLRKRVISSIDEGMSIENASNLFKISGRVIYKWLDLREEYKSLTPKSGYQKGHSHKLKDLDAFKDFVENNKYCTISEMKSKWFELKAQSISNTTIQRTLKKIGYTFKKKALITAKQTQ